MKNNAKKEPQEGGEGKHRLHNVRFYTMKPTAIVSMAYSKTSKCLALSRHVPVIQLWNLRHTPYLDQVIHLPPDSPAESLAWAGNRLFSVDLTGKLIEWDLTNLKPRHEHSPTGNALWSLDVNPAETEIAVGSEEGHINLLSIENDEITYKSLFTKQSGRVLCIKFDKTGTKLVTGTEGFVHIWNVLKGTTLHTMTLSDNNVIVWSLQVLSDNTIIAGDSAGFVTVWNAENATQIDSTRVLDKNVFALAVNETEDRLVCSGMQPPLIRLFNKTQIKREESTSERWIKFLQRDAHKHYVKSLVVIRDKIFSGGLDGILTITSSHKMRGKMSQHAPFLKGCVASLAITEKLLLLRYPRSLHLWRLGSAASQDKDKITGWGQPLGTSEELLLEQPPQKLLQLNVKGPNITQASAISPDANWICYSTSDELRIRRLQRNPLQVERLVGDLPKELQPASHIIFTKKKRLALLHPQNNHLSWFDLKEDSVIFKYSVDLSDHCKNTISHLVVSSGGDYLVAATSDKIISVWNLHEKQYKHLLNLPKHQAGTTALSMHEDHPRVVVAYANGQIVEYDLVNRKFTCETKRYLIPDTRQYCINGITLDPRNPNVFLVHTETNLYVLERNDDFEPKEEPVVESKTKKLSKGNSSSVAVNTKSLSLKTQLPRQHLVHVSRLSPNELVNVSISTNNLLATLPPPFQRKKFGAS
ncbi:U3 small nucleolar RNA-associated protein 4 homolog [Drosophila subpulchrella]|uniref:U3 small nucleolar RNA-associated protein 4 homolog n=1 Tax=Drosophila subpulchrella TaxID=1486046 RepID=UPI0018A18F0A|nr:U3 small nucleolar RNA-associated protein 4 homolog [Drosophila subpulchrella]